jgi:gliding-associated putative ABC transporter substrate-binding component GldG
MTKKQVTVLMFLSVICIVLCFMISRRLWIRFDLTKNKGYTISKVSRTLYTEIPDQVQITYYLSERLSAAVPIPGEIVDLLREYTAYSHGKIRFSVRDPLKANLIDVVEQLGIVPQQIQTVEQDQANIATVYSGIVIEYLDKTDVIPVVFSLETLEYDLTTRIRSLVRGTQREAGFLVGDTSRQWNRDYSDVNQAFVQAGFQVRTLNSGDEIPDALGVLFVLGGAEDLDDWALYRIDRYIQGGGKVFFALESIAVSESMEPRRMSDTGLLDMVSAYGAAVKPELVLDRTALNLQYQMVDGSGRRMYRITPYPFWIAVLEQNGNSRHPVTSGFSGVDLYWANPLELELPASVEGEALFTTTVDAWVQKENFIVNPEMPAIFNQDNATQGTKILAAALSGKFPSYFAEIPKPVREGSEEELPDMPTETAESRIIVVGDTDMATNLSQYTGSTRNNIDLLLKAADWLGNDDDIIGIRSRLPQTGRFDKITDDGERIKTMRFVQTLNVVIIPLAVVILGILRSLQRRRTLKAIQLKGRENSDDV